MKLQGLEQRSQAGPVRGLAAPPLQPGLKAGTLLLYRVPHKGKSPGENLGSVETTFVYRQMTLEQVWC